MNRRPWIALAAVGLGGLLLAGPAAAQSIQLDLGEEGGMATARVVQLVALMTVLSIAPSLLVMVTSFTRIIIVLSFLRTALGTQSVPPNQVLTSLALFVTLFIMMPTFQESYDQGIRPMIENRMEEMEGFTKAAEPFRKFMVRYTREQDLHLFADIAKVSDEELKGGAPFRILLPAFMISELRRSFEMGFLIFIPFLVIDMVVASVLMAMGMMMLPPVIVSMPFKIIFFVLVDGWYMIVGSLVKSFGG
ncbi:MAG: flagellar type III secretion system pore protein FliP [Magnetospirillum sp. WYHS-4]